MPPRPQVLTHHTACRKRPSVIRHAGAYDGGAMFPRLTGHAAAKRTRHAELRRKIPGTVVRALIPLLFLSLRMSEREEPGRPPSAFKL